MTTGAPQLHLVPVKSIHDHGTILHGIDFIDPLTPVAQKYILL